MNSEQDRAVIGLCSAAYCVRVVVRLRQGGCLGGCQLAQTPVTCGAIDHHRVAAGADPKTSSATRA